MGGFPFPYVGTPGAPGYLRPQKIYREFSLWNSSVPFQTLVSYFGLSACPCHRIFNRPFGDPITLGLKTFFCPSITHTRTGWICPRNVGPVCPLNVRLLEVLISSQAYRREVSFSAAKSFLHKCVWSARGKFFPPLAPSPAHGLLTTLDWIRGSLDSVAIIFPHNVINRPIKIPKRLLCQ